MPAEDESSVKSLSQSTARSQKLTAKSTDNNAGRRRARKRTFRDSEKKLDDKDFVKRLKNAKYLIKVIIFYLLHMHARTKIIIMQYLFHYYRKRKKY